MKCVCGYERQYGFGNPLEKKGDEEFIYIEGMFEIRQDYSNNRKVKMYACPKCNTVQMSRW